MACRSLTALHRLQEVETHLRSLENMLARKDRILRQQETRIKQLQEQIISRREDIKARQSQVGQLELEFKARDAGVSKLRTQLNAARSNKEYSAILTQLNTDRADNSKLEERILEGLTQIDEMKTGLNEMEKNVDVETEQLRRRQAEQKDERDDIQRQIDELRAKKQEMAESLSPDDLATFQRVADRNDGEALASIIKPGGSDQYICEGCHMGIPMEIVNALLTRDDLQACPICGRILFLEEQFQDNAEKQKS